MLFFLIKLLFQLSGCIDYKPKLYLVKPCWQCSPQKMLLSFSDWLKTIQIQIFKTLNFSSPAAIMCVPIQVSKRNECKLTSLYDSSCTCMYVKALVCVCTQVWSWPVQGPYQSETAVHTHSGAGERTSGLLAYVERMQRRLHLWSLRRAARRASGTTEPAGQLCQYLLFQI